MTRRLLMIAYIFPPSLWVGRIRTLKFCKYLPEFDWKPVVLTHKLPGKFDPELLHEIPHGTVVHRVGRDDQINNFINRASRLKKTFKDWNRVDASHTTGESDTAVANQKSQWKKLFFWPDEAALWIFAATRKALGLAGQCDALYSSGPPATCHLVALRVAKVTGLPWIMDYRDPWMVDLSYPTGLQNRLFWRLERDCVATCSRLINVNEPRTEAHRKAFPNEPADKFMTLPNGFDPEDFEDLPVPNRNGPLTISYLGNLYGGRSAAPVIRAMAQLWRSGQVKINDLRLQLIGNGSEGFVSLAEQLGITRMLHVSERIKYREALAELARSHVGVLFGGSVDFRSTPTKMYEYFYLKKPMFAVLRPGALWKLMRLAGVPCFLPEDEQRISQLLLSLLNDFQSGRPLPVPSGLADLNDHSRHLTARRLVEALNHR